MIMFGLIVESGPVCELRSIGYSSGFRIADVGMWQFLLFSRFMLVITLLTEMSVLRDVLEHQTVCLRSLLQYSQPHYVSEIFGRMGQGLRSAIHCVHTCITPYTPFLIS